MKEDWMKRKVRDFWSKELSRKGWYRVLVGQEVNILNAIREVANWQYGLYFPGLIKVEEDYGVNRCHVGWNEWKLFHFGIFDRWGSMRAQGGEMRLLRVCVPPPECDPEKVGKIRHLLADVLVDKKREHRGWKRLIIYQKDEVLSTREQEKGGFIIYPQVELPIFTSYTKELNQKTKDIDTGKDRKILSTTPEPKYEDPKKLLDQEKDKEVKELLKKTQGSFKDRADKIG